MLQLGMFDLWPVMNKCTVVAKRELFYAWPFGLAAWLSGLIFINRMQTDKARNALYDAAEIVREKRIKLWIFPEGTRRNTGELHSFKKGAFHMAIAAQLPILPVVFSTYQTFLDDNNKTFGSGKLLYRYVFVQSYKLCIAHLAGKIIVTSLPPISTIGLTKDNLEGLMKQTYDIMRTQFLLTSSEVQSDLLNGDTNLKSRPKPQLSNHQITTESINEV